MASWSEGFGGRYLLGDEPVGSVEAYEAAGGGEGLRRAHALGPTATIEVVAKARLRGRGGGGFPTGVKWRSVADAGEGQRRFVVCNAAEGEPGTFKDRALIRANPFQLLEGIAIASYAVGAEQAYIGLKAGYEIEARRIEAAVRDMTAAGILGDVPINVVTGPDDYLLGEEKGLLEAIEGRPPFPRWYPPYVLGLHAGMPAGVGAASVGWDERFNPAVVNNVETLSNVPHILRNGVEWFRSIGTEDSPGSMVFTVSGDVRRETVFELPLGTPLAFLVHGVGDGVAEGRRIGAVFPGVANAPIPERLLDVPLDFSSLQAVGSGLGSGGMIVYDDTACVVGAAMTFSRFLAVESCGQCPPCKLGTGALTERLRSLEEGAADLMTIDEIQAWVRQVTDANRCGLGAGEQALVAGLFRMFPEVVADHVGRGCTSTRDVPIPKIVDWLPEAGRFVYDTSYFSRRTP